MGLLVGFISIGRIFSCTHEAMFCPIVGDRIVFLASLLHPCFSVRNGGANTGIVAGITTVHRSINGGDILGWRAIKDKRGAKVMAIRSKAERLTSAPAEAGNRQFAVRRRKFLHVIGS